METVRNFARTLGPVRLAVLGGVALLLTGFFIWVFTQASTPRLALLYGDLEMSAAAKIASQLDASGIPYDLRNGGTAVFVAADQVARTRLSLAEQGLPGGGSIGYEIFDASEPLGTTTFQQNINLVRALEGELARTIRAIETVKGARVHLVLPKRDVFSRDKPEASASVLLQMRGRDRLTSSQVAAVQQLIASAVPGLSPARISIVDGHGTLLSDDAHADEVTQGAGKADQRRRQMESRLARTVEELVERVVGPGKVRTEVSVEMDFDRVNTSEEIFNPDGQVVRSTQTVEQTGSSKEAGSAAVSVATNLPDARPDGANADGASSSENRSEETVNYEISKKVINHVRESGVVKRLSVAVLVDGVYVAQPDGSRSYQPRPAEEMEQLANLVRGAVGFNAERGDRVELLSLRFAEPEAPREETSDLPLGLDKSDLMRIGQYLALFVLALLVLLLVIKPLVTKAMEAVPAAAAAGLPKGLLPQPHAAAALPGPGMDGMHEGYIGEGGEGREEMIDIERITGRVKASSLKRVSEIVDKHPEESLAILRNWLHSEE